MIREIAAITMISRLEPITIYTNSMRIWDACFMNICRETMNDDIIFPSIQPKPRLTPSQYIADIWNFVVPL